MEVRCSVVRTFHANPQGLSMMLCLDNSTRTCKIVIVALDAYGLLNWIFYLSHLELTFNNSFRSYAYNIIRCTKFKMIAISFVH